jgi:CRISPR/Cas system-associated exonuclease Cas4 (RecB family)
MRRLQNEFSWSKTRDAVFATCPRQYWYQYYGSWGGWESRADPRTREIYVLKQLKSRHMWAGERVHGCIERTLANLAASSRPLAVDVDEIVALTLSEMRLDFKSSRSGQYRSRPKTCALFEHEYQLSVADEEWKRIAEMVERCLRTFYGSDVYARILESDRADWLECEQFSAFWLDGVKVHVKLDFAVREGATVRIYDWKTGASDERDNRVQMACYALYAREQWGAEPEAVQPVVFNLNRDELMTHAMTAADLERTREFMRGSIADMQRLLRLPGKNVAAEDDFRRVNDARTCHRCSFFRVCGPDVEGTPAGGA